MYLVVFTKDELDQLQIMKFDEINGNKNYGKCH